MRPREGMTLSKSHIANQGPSLVVYGLVPVLGFQGDGTPGLQSWFACEDSTEELLLETPFP